MKWRVWKNKGCSLHGGVFYIHSQVRHSSRGEGRKGFIGEFLENLKQELNKNKEMTENIKKFRNEAKKLEESDALQQARKKYVSANCAI